jgi:hypothetical protein
MFKQYKSRSQPRAPRSNVSSSSAAAGRSSNAKPDFAETTAQRQAFLARLARMSVEERLRSARYGGFNAWQRSLWAARFPDEVPLVNGEFEWIALTLADLD